MGNNRVQQAVEPLIGLKLSVSRRAADMRIFHFGDIREVNGGTVGQYALHIQCPWRVDGPDGIVTGRSDLWEHISGKGMPDDWEPGTDDNVQDTRLRDLFGDFGAGTLLNPKNGQKFVVETAQANELGDLEIGLTGGYHLIVFPAGTSGEAWRLFEPGKETPHFVVEGSGVYVV
jgi:hypothetical protein